MATSGPKDNNFSTINMSNTSAANITSGRMTEFDDYHFGLVALAFLILIFNVFAIQTYRRHEKIRRNCGNVLLLSLAISDLIIGVLYLPIVIFCESRWTQYSTNENFVNGCRGNYFVANFSGFSTIFHIIALTLEKYLAVLHPFQKMNVSTRGTYRRVLVTIWLLALAFALVPAVWMFDNPWSSPWKYKFHVYGITQASIFLGLSSVVLMYCYVRMFFQIHIKLSSHTQTGRVQTKARNDRKTVLIFLLFFTIFVVGWTPWFFFALETDNEKLVLPEIKDFLVSLRYGGQVLNPLLYSFIKSDYKQAVQADLRNLCSSCPASIGFEKLIQSSTLRRQSNTLRHGTLTTDSGNVKLKKIESTEERRDFGSVPSGISGPQLSSQTEDTDL
jgi:hypothetical protein